MNNFYYISVGLYSPFVELDQNAKILSRGYLTWPKRRKQ